MRTLQAWMGHSSLEQTMRYAKHSPSETNQLIDRLAPRRPLHAIRGEILERPKQNPLRQSQRGSYVVGTTGLEPEDGGEGDEE